jgi:hypothetical protein
MNSSPFFAHVLGLRGHQDQLRVLYRSIFDFRQEIVQDEG